MASQIEIYAWQDMNPILKEKLQQAPFEEWGHLSFIRDTYWSTPTWSLVIHSSADDFLCFVNIVERIALFDQKKVRVGGINNLMTKRDCRGQGYGACLMEGAHHFMKESLKVDSGLLLCADDVSGFYEKLGWEKFSGKLYFNQPQDKVLWHQNTYLFPFDLKTQGHQIDLCGYPW